MKKYAVIVAGGTGTRMGKEIPKQFLLLKGKPVLYYTIHTFLKAFTDLEVILVLPLEYIDMGNEIIDAYFDKKRIKVIAGGETRFHSVKNGLSLIEEEGIVFVHDGVRCLVTADLIKRCYAQAKEEGSAVPAIACNDSVRLITADSNRLLERSNIRLIQTPQTFHSKILIPAFNIDYKERFTDEANVVEAFGMAINLVEGEETNIKITRPLDLFIAEKIMEEKK
ncbi:MAG: 2-C-methyl-D-erythritol 4-phosphate cytidylyltransferase [Sphingobacteriales bacterium]|nr:MAG: 2-C-methyl-D-erythritol 4-phosphate cytidylyltransferase [Sphingobacteriales bacterium]